jgi:thioesterase DpgC
MAGGDEDVNAPAVSSVYEEVTDGLRKSLRVDELVYVAAERFPGLLPTRVEIAEERTRLQKDKLGREIAQGEFVSEVLADDDCGAHLVRAMSQPRSDALDALERFRRAGDVDLGPVRVNRDGPVGWVTFQNYGYLNAEDDESTRAMEIAIDLVLLDESIETGVLRGGRATHPKHAGRRVFGSGINLTRLYDGQISLVEFMLERELGPILKMQRGHHGGAEKPWIAAVESFAIGGAFQWLLVMDRVIAEEGSYFSLPARGEGIVPGCAGLRLPRFLGERRARQAIFFGRTFEASQPDSDLLVDDVVEAEQIQATVERAAEEIAGLGTTSLLANRRALVEGHEPLDRFRSYMSHYAREQARCLYSQELIANLERHWRCRRRAS